MTARPRTIVTADPELDDLNSMIRLVLYSNEIEIEGLIYASSRYHWKGDGEGTTFFHPDREYSEPRTSWRWAPDERFIDDVLDAYAAVRDTLVVHDPRYPHPDALRAVVREGNIAFEGDVSEESPGSRLIADTLLDDRPGPVFLQVWAGTSTIARALLLIEERYRGTPDWERVHREVSAKAVITKFDSQDDTYADDIAPTWPGIRVVDVATWTWGYSARHLVLPADQHLLQAEWMRTRVTSVGPLGALYRTWGDGRRMVEDDPTDFFHLSGRSAEELSAEGYQVWTDVQAPGEWISEGDSTNLLALLPVGLRPFEDPGFGGWGGRAVRVGPERDEWSVQAAADSDDSGNQPPEYSVSRWFAQAQGDFAARLQWSVSPSYEQAAHHPVLRVSPEETLDASPGDVLTLRAEAVDPDGGTVVHRWWQYREAGSFPGTVELAGADTSEVTVSIPEGCFPDQTIHLVLEVGTDRPGALVTHRRTVVRIARPARD